MGRRVKDPRGGICRSILGEEGRGLLSVGKFVGKEQYMPDHSCLHGSLVHTSLMSCQPGMLEGHRLQ